MSLVLSDERLEHTPGEGSGPPGSSTDRGRSDRVTLVGKGRRASPAAAARLESLGYLRLHEHCHVTGNLRGDAGAYGESTRHGNDGGADTVPRHYRHAKAEDPSVGFNYSRPGRSQRRQRSNSAAELRWEVLQCRLEHVGTVSCAEQPAGRFEPERRG